MWHIITTRKLDQIKRDARHEGITKGYELGYTVKQVETRNRALILGDFGSKLDQELAQMLKKKGVENELH